MVRGRRHPQLHAPRPARVCRASTAAPGCSCCIGLAALVGAGLVVAAAFALARPACRRGQPFWLVVCLLGWAALAAAVASRAAELFLAPVNYASGDGPGVTSTVAPAWATYFWTVAAACAALAGALLVRWALAGRARAAQLTVGPACAVTGAAGSVRARQAASASPPPPRRSTWRTTLSSSSLSSLASPR